MTEADNKLLFVAKCGHEMNRQLCQLTGDNSQVPWSDAEQWQRDSAIDGVKAIMEGRVKGPGDSHRQWMEHKKSQGWKHGPVKDPDKKEHPDLVPFEELPPVAQLKDHIFFQTISHILKSDYPK